MAIGKCSVIGQCVVEAVRPDRFLILSGQLYTVNIKNIPDEKMMQSLIRKI